MVNPVIQATRTIQKLLLMSCVLCVTSQLLAGNSNQPHYRVIQTIPVGGDVHWDCLTLDASNHRLFIAHSDRVDIVNVNSGKLIGSVPNAEGVHSVALAPDIGRGFFSNGKADTVTIFDSHTLRSLGTVITGGKPDAILYKNASREVIVANADSHVLTTIDAVKGLAIHSIALSGEPEFMALGGDNYLYVNLVDVAKIARVDLKNNRVESEYDLNPDCEEPTGLAIDERRQRLFISCRNKVMMVLSATTGDKLAVLPIGANTDGAAYDSATDMAFSANGEGTLTVITRNNKDQYRVSQTVKTMAGARTLALDTYSHRIYLVAAKLDRVEPPTAERPFLHYQFKPNTFRVVVVGPN